MCQYAIRPTLRAHSTLKRGDVINKVASLIAPRHKVNLTAPDKVILIDIFQVCTFPNLFPYPRTRGPAVAVRRPVTRKIK